jgi:hypothetical protein
MRATATSSNPSSAKLNTTPTISRRRLHEGNDAGARLPPKEFRFSPEIGKFAGRGEQTLKSPSRRRMTRATLSTSWPQSAAKGFPQSLPSPAPPTRRGETLQARGGVSSCSRGRCHLHICPEVRRPPHAPHPPPPRCPRSRGSVL